ncbi:hypothetical protein [Pedobacter sp. SYSU D00535]|uniref:hypothetical protein n=1 Tax=Pedobacter sp. SYSU D00535 TaxID=2810308 RepID=UPI001A97A9A4|nr:hypothetical protein [Pedobacter sp. SYSU D00535]
MKKILLSVIALLLVTTTFAQKKVSEGTITYQVEWQLPPQMQQMKAMFPPEITVYFKGDSSASETKSPMSTARSVMNPKTEYQRLLLDIPMMGKKYSVLFTPDDQEQMKEHWPELTVTPGTETKTIAGYNAKKHTVTEKKSNTTFDAWFTKDVDITQNSLTQFFDASYGFPLQFNSFQNGVGLKATVKEVKSGSVPKGSFSATKEYEEITFAQLMAMMNRR